MVERTTPVGFRLTVTERDALDAYAASVGRDRSGLLRRLLVKEGIIPGPTLTQEHEDAEARAKARHPQRTAGDRSEVEPRFKKGAR